MSRLQGALHTERVGRKHDVGRPRQVWVRIVPALPGSLAESEGWAFECARGRGAFPAVVFQ